MNNNEAGRTSGGLCAEGETLPKEWEEDVERDHSTTNSPEKKKSHYPERETDMQAGIRLGKLLDKVHSIEGVRAADLFRDFLEIVELTLLRLPVQLDAVLKTGRVEAEDPPEIVGRWKAISEKYRNPKEVFKCFAEGFNYLLEQSVKPEGGPSYADVIGCAYMQFLSLRDQSYKGQFFTPSPVAKLMAEISCGEIEELVKGRLKEALEKSPIAQAMGMALSVCMDQDGINELAWKYMGPLIKETYEPVSIMDPCVGSGVMLLAAASTIPRQYTDLGLVQYYGIDIDPICVQMCRINVMLYGLNGWSYRLERKHESSVRITSGEKIWEAGKAPEAVIEALPEPAHTLYREIRVNPTPEAKAHTRKKLIEGQMSLFAVPVVETKAEDTPIPEREL
jgi:hypothetical protein